MPLNASEFPISHHSNNDWSWKRLRRADYGEWSTYSEWHWLNEVGLDCRCWWRRPRPWQRQRVPRHWNANMCARKSESHKADFNLMSFSFRMSINQVDLFTRHWLFNQSRFTQQDQQTRKKNQLNIALNYRLCMCEYWNQFNKHISVLLCHSNRRIFCRRIELKALRIPLHMTKRTEMTSFAQAFKGCIVMFNVIIRRIERERIEIVGCHYVSGLAK